MKSINFNRINMLMVCAGLCLMISCRKDFLEAKPSTGLLGLRTIKDFQQLLSNTEVFNLTGSLPLAASDEYEIPDNVTWQSLLQLTSKNSYIWKKDLYGGQINIADWNTPYTAVFYANAVLEALVTSPDQGSDEWKRTKGWALFARAFAFYDLAQNFCTTYDAGTAATEKGIPLRLKAGIDELLPRATLKQTYDQLLSDLVQARTLLPNQISKANRNEPSRAGVFALLSRIYLSKRDYNKAEVYADSCLSLYGTLMDYNTISQTENSPFSFSNPEIIYYSTQTNDLAEVTYSPDGTYTIAKGILDLFQENDLRLPIFFSTIDGKNTVLKRGYSQKALVFTGLATDEIYLIKAECLARRNEVNATLAYLNKLLINRYATDKLPLLTATSSSEALDLVLKEREKELVRRGLRWSDLKRLNKEGAGITLSRNLNGQVYLLPPNDPRYIFPIPDDEISYSGVEQNIR